VIRSVTVCGRHPEPPDHPLFAREGVRYVFGLEPLAPDTIAVLLAVPDEVVPELAYAVSGHGPAPEACAAFHLSGSLPTDVLAPLHERGFGVGVFEPLVSIVDPTRGADRFPGSYVAVTASPETLRVAWILADAIGAEVLAVPAVRRPLFHAATSLVASTLTPLVEHGARLMEHAGVEEDEAIQALIPLLRSILASIEEGGVPAAFAGPVARGDVETSSLHLRALDPEDQRFYALIGREVLRLTGERSPRGTLDEDTREELAALFRRYTELETTGAGTGH
jgi:predicted short-subunit dehydrogenase-like oxidoreductase (DUF2520 family)